MLDSYSQRIQASNKVTPSSNTDKKCLQKDPRQPWLNWNGLDKNEFICYDEDLIQKEYLTCSNTIALTRKKVVVFLIGGTFNCHYIIRTANRFFIFVKPFGNSFTVWLDVSVLNITTTTTFMFSFHFTFLFILFILVDTSSSTYTFLDFGTWTKNNNFLPGKSYGIRAC